MRGCTQVRTEHRGVLLVDPGHLARPNRATSSPQRTWTTKLLWRFSKQSSTSQSWPKQCTGMRMRGRRRLKLVAPRHAPRQAKAATAAPPVATATVMKRLLMNRAPSSPTSRTQTFLARIWWRRCRSFTTPRYSTKRTPPGTCTSRLRLRWPYHVMHLKQVYLPMVEGREIWFGKGRSTQAALTTNVSP